MKWVYQRTEAGVFTVGFYNPDGVWHPVEDYASSDEAARRVHYLNGGCAHDHA